LGIVTPPVPNYITSFLFIINVNNLLQHIGGYSYYHKYIKYKTKYFKLKQSNHIM
jgi:hypothetical protein